MVEIGDLKILLWEAVDEKGNSRFGDFFDGQISIRYKFKDNKKYPASPFSYLQNEDLWQICDNIPFDALISSYEQLIGKNPHIFEMANLDLLYMLETYDKLSEEKSLRKEELLAYSEKLSCWLMDKDNSEQLKEMYFVNYCQVLKRENKLGEDELAKLRKILSNEKLEPIMKVGVSLLLGDKVNFEEWLSKCTKEDAANLKRFPIWHFYNDLDKK